MNLKDERILALDPSTYCGWAFAVEGRISQHGLFLLKIKPTDPIGLKWVLFKNNLEDFIDTNKVTQIVVERAAGMHFKGVESHNKLICVIEMIGFVKSIPITSVSAKQIKLWATGDGNASKSEMVQFAAKKFNYKGKDDNIADALHLLDFQINQIRKI